MLPSIETPRLRLRAYAPSDLDTLVVQWDHPWVRRYLFDDKPVTREWASRILERCREENSKGLGMWMIEVANAAEPIGCVALISVGPAGEFDPGIAGLVEPTVALDPRHWGRGFAREALRAILNYGFEQLKLPRVAAAADAPNLPSQRMLSDMGFRFRIECEGPAYRQRTYILEASDFNAPQSATGRKPNPDSDAQHTSP